MLRGQFEKETRMLVRQFPDGYDDMHWRIKYDLIDGEYFVRWSNGIMGRGHKEWTCYFKNDEFIFY